MALGFPGFLEGEAIGQVHQLCEVLTLGEVGLLILVYFLLGIVLQHFVG